MHGRTRGKIIYDLPALSLLISVDLFLSFLFSFITTRNKFLSHFSLLLLPLFSFSFRDFSTFLFFSALFSALLILTKKILFARQVDLAILMHFYGSRLLMFYTEKIFLFLQ